MSKSTLPLVSVVIPMYNVEKYIRQCLDSVLAQSFRNFEVVCVDDGCSDHTVSLVKQYADERIRIISQRNRGLSGARNTGILNAKGLYVAFLDADDYWAPDKLAIHVNHLNANPNVKVSFSPSLFVDDNGDLMGIGQFPAVKNITFKTVLCRNPIGNGSAPVIRKQTLLSHAYPVEGQDRMQIFNESLRQSEDIELWVRIAADNEHCFEGVVMPLTYYRVNETGLSANWKKQYQSWFTAISVLKRTSKKITPSLFSLANAYQLRYLARRAIQSGNAKAAILLVHQALFSNPKILLEETQRTLLTYICALLVVAPKSLYKPLESFVMKLSSLQLQKNLSRAG